MNNNTEQPQPGGSQDPGGPSAEERSAVAVQLHRLSVTLVGLLTVAGYTFVAYLVTFGAVDVVDGTTAATTIVLAVCAAVFRRPLGHAVRRRIGRAAAALVGSDSDLT